MLCFPIILTSESHIVIAQNCNNNPSICIPPFLVMCAHAQPCPTDVETSACRPTAAYPTHSHHQSYNIPAHGITHESVRNENDMAGKDSWTSGEYYEVLEEVHMVGRRILGRGVQVPRQLSGMKMNFKGHLSLALFWLSWR